jgi:hypothetical protein
LHRWGCASPADCDQLEKAHVAEDRPANNSLHDLDFVRRVNCYLENRISPADLSCLEEELLAEPKKQKAFIELCLTRRGTIELFRRRAQSSELMDASVDVLAEDLDAESVLSNTMILPAIRMSDVQPDEVHAPGPVSLPLPQPQSAPIVSRKVWVRAAAIFLPILSGIIAWTIYHNQSPPVVISSDQKIARVMAPKPVLATLKLSLDAQWDNSGASLPLLADLSGPHSLDHGLAQITLAGGATVVVQAPAEFKIVSATDIDLASGQISAVVPHDGGGLTVDAPNLHVVDLGTEFGVDVSPFKQTHVEVFVGKVRVELPPVNGVAPVQQTIDANHAVDVKPNSRTIEPAAPAPLGFVRASELISRAAAGENTALQRWQSFSQTLRQDPDLVAYYTFDNQNDSPDKLINRSQATTGRHDGVLGIPGVADSAPRWSQGRWPGKGSLEFGRSNTTVVTLPSEGQFTSGSPHSYVIWLKRSELTRQVHLISQPSGDRRCFNIAVVGTAGKKQINASPNTVNFDFGPDDAKSPAILPTQSRWFLLAITVTPDSQAHFYIDGQLMAQAPIKIAAMDRSADLWLGRSDPALKDTAAGDILHGWVDELAIFSRALSSSEIQRIYDAGKPQ